MSQRRFFASLQRIQKALSGVLDRYAGFVFIIFRNSHNTVSILATSIDPAVKDGSLAALSRSYAVASEQIFPKDLLSGVPYNAELVKQLTPEMQEILVK